MQKSTSVCEYPVSGRELLQTRNEMTTASMTLKMPKDGKGTHVEINMRKSSPECAPFNQSILCAALAPCPQTFSVLKSACRTCEDHLWAQISILCEEKQTADMMKLDGGFWDGGLAILENMPSPPSKEEGAAEEEEWEATSALEPGSVHVEDSLTADHAFHVSQPVIILDQTNSLLETFATGLGDGNFDPDSSEYPIMTRFSPTCLYLQTFDILVSPLATQVILEPYLQLITMYAGAPGDIGVARYAMFLTSPEITTDIDSAFEGPILSVIALQATPSYIELLLFRSIEWMTFEDGTHGTAPEQATAILRYFPGAGRVLLVKDIVEMLPR
ncbi:hypothetical protein DEU56DRAFT_911201 [Suillus clintonianus]|uniref:uncharacterized protein n=1 Tax=Suillus clintonianus TaxID=1904413 RepID=UPI001B860A40|nr:uncharacterized protein DEU56DRAFT_911201 [Suillus clintonianus]KAG2141851.1 hypothetical protein DEU56DRAFT_911201 [Suillus clintonianus]